MLGLASQVISTLPLLADTFDHHGWGGGWWVVMAVAMVAFWALIIGGAIWLVREIGRRPERGVGSEPAPLEILDRRLAEGAISVEEYEKRRRLLSSDEAGAGG